MSLYGDLGIELDALKRWVSTLKVDNISRIEIGGEYLTLDDHTRELLKVQTEGFTELINCLEPEDDWRGCQGILSPMFYNAFVRMNNSAIRIGNFYECLITPSNMKTYKKIIKGFDNIDCGAIYLYDSMGKCIASVGMKSDLMWTTFYDYFVNTNADGMVNHTYERHEQYLSIQLFDTENKTLDQITALINEMLLRISMEYDMDFRVFEVNPIFKETGENAIKYMKFEPTGYEQVPMLYLNNAINTSDERLAYLSYYQVIEYFFVRAQNYYFLDELSAIDMQNVDHNELRKILSEYKKISNEREALRLVFLKSIDIEKFKYWLNSNLKYEQIYCNSPNLKIDITKEDKKIISQLVNRVYSYRCSIAHAKGDVEEYIAIPFLSKQTIEEELPLLKYLAFEVITHCSET